MSVNTTKYRGLVFLELSLAPQKIQIPISNSFCLPLVKKFSTHRMQWWIQNWVIIERAGDFHSYSIKLTFFWTWMKHNPFDLLDPPLITRPHHLLQMTIDTIVNGHLVFAANRQYRHFTPSTNSPTTRQTSTCAFFSRAADKNDSTKKKKKGFVQRIVHEGRVHPSPLPPLCLCSLREHVLKITIMLHHR